ncbi:hypothetical protein CEE44_03425 [Candidatus Woesearchaeota archaeon B3_Woes]|nr:MAG: hypothetical protein CEE44_03425 [Candidatus Woesearchaeota archaeon B3_Woes]
MSKTKITKNSLLGDVMKIEGSHEVLSKHNVPCLGCAMVHMEMGFLKIGDICKNYGIDSEKLLKELNKL